MSLACGGQDEQKPSSASSSEQDPGPREQEPGAVAEEDEPVDEPSPASPPTCSPAPGVLGVHALYEASALELSEPSPEFFRYPWPALGRDNASLAVFPNPASAVGCSPGASTDFLSLLNGAVDPIEYRAYLAELSANSLDGASAHPTFYVSFSGALNSAALPTPQQSLEADSPVFLVNIEPGSEEEGRHVPLQTRIYTGSRYLPENTLAAMPYPGFPLLANEHYALIVRRTLGDATGAPLGSSEFLEGLKRGQDCTGPAEQYQSAFHFLEAELALEPAEIAAISVHVVGEPRKESQALQTLVTQLESPTQFAATGLNGPAVSGPGGSWRLEGVVSVPMQQSADPPYLPEVAFTGLSASMSFNAEDTRGTALIDSLGAGDAQEPTRPRSAEVPFSLYLPDSFPANPAALPVVLYAPGTGGGLDSAAQNGVVERLTAQGFAVFTLLPVAHGIRAGSENVDAELRSTLATLDLFGGTDYEQQLLDFVESGELFFNPFQLNAARGNSLQAAVELHFIVRLLKELSLEVTLGTEVETLSFQQVHFFGHSQGGSTGPLLAEVSDIESMVLSGVSAHLPSALLGKTKPADSANISQMLSYVICDAPEEPLDATHPVLSMLSHYLEAVDAEHYAHHLTGGASPLSTFTVVGVADSYAPPIANQAFVTASRMNEVIAPVAVEAPWFLGMELQNMRFPMKGFDEPSSSVFQNQNGITAAFRQFDAPGCSDDHFAFVCSEAAQNSWEAFLVSAQSGVPTAE